MTDNPPCPVCKHDDCPWPGRAPDSLVARLRLTSPASSSYFIPLCAEAADRIEQQDRRIGELEIDVARRSKQYSELAERNDAAEARLALIEQERDEALKRVQHWIDFEAARQDAIRAAKD